MKITEAIEILKTEKQHGERLFCLYGNYEHAKYIIHKVFGPSVNSSIFRNISKIYKGKWRNAKCLVYSTYFEKPKFIRNMSKDCKKFLFELDGYDEIEIPVVFLCSHDPTKDLKLQHLEVEKFKEKFIILDCSDLENDTKLEFLDYYFFFY